MKPPIPANPERIREPSVRLSSRGGALLAVSLFQPLDGSWILRHGSLGPIRLRCGDLLVVRESYLVEVESIAGGEALHFFAPPDWATRAMHLARAIPGQTVDAVCLEPAHSDTARRAGRLLAEGHLRSNQAEPEDAMAEAVRHLALLSIAREARKGLDDVRLRTPASGSRHKSDLLRALAALEAETALEDLSLDRFAAKLGFSPRHASRLFRRELGYTFSDYTLKLRIERAKKLLASTSRPVTEIAMETGWGSVSHFNATFRRRVGFTPSEFRSRAA